MLVNRLHLIPVLTLVCHAGALADDLVTVSGHRYKDVEVVRADGDSVTVRHRLGESKISFSDMRPEDRSKLVRLPQKKSQELPAITVSGQLSLDSAKENSLELANNVVKEQIQKRQEKEEAKTKNPFWNADAWRYVPIHLGETDPTKDGFSTPNYLKPEYRQVETPQTESVADFISGRH